MERENTSAERAGDCKPSSCPPAVLDHSCALPQRDGGARPAFAGGAVGGERELVVLDAREVLDEGPQVDAEGEVRPRRHRGS